MAKAPAKPRSPKRRKRRAPPERKRSGLGRLAAAGIGIAGTAGVLTGLATPTAEVAPTCGGSERWNVKVANDKDALTGKIDLMPGTPLTISQVNDQIKPEPYPVGGRMNAERKVYTVRGFLSFFKHEGGRKGDQDYHVVITDQPGQFEEDERKPPNGHSMVVEFPDTKCFAGKTGGSTTSPLGQAIADARATFESHVEWPKDRKLTQPIPVTVTGVGFFDFDHGQTGRARPRIGADGKRKVFELHPVTEIVFDSEPPDT
jgi:hypothetical protein